MEVLFPKLPDICACGCNRQLPNGRKKWFSDTCQKDAYFRFAIVKGDVQVIRQALFSIDQGFCRNCGSLEREWHADHIVPVFQGGAACDISNFQTLCVSCHAEKTRNQMRSHIAAISSHAALSSSMDLT